MLWPRRVSPLITLSIAASMTYRKHDDDISLALDHNTQIISHFKPLEGLMNESILD
jgi:hypothetical protein